MDEWRRHACDCGVVYIEMYSHVRGGCESSMSEQNETDKTWSTDTYNMVLVEIPDSTSHARDTSYAGRAQPKTGWKVHRKTPRNWEQGRTNPSNIARGADSMVVAAPMRDTNR